MWGNSGLNVEVFHRGSDFSKLHDYEVIVTATGAPDLITDEMIRSGAVIVDAGTASEGGKLVGDISDEIRERTDISAITPKIGGVGPLTVGVLFENVLMAAERAKQLLTPVTKYGPVKVHIFYHFSCYGVFVGSFWLLFCEEV